MYSKLQVCNLFKTIIYNHRIAIISTPLEHNINLPLPLKSRSYFGVNLGGIEGSDATEVPLNRQEFAATVLSVSRAVSIISMAKGKERESYVDRATREMYLYQVNSECEKT